ncbi:MAG: hypothetical protein WAQ33_05430 [Gaiellaceae bacterium]
MPRPAWAVAVAIGLIVTATGSAATGRPVRFSIVVRESSQPALGVAPPFLRVVPNATSVTYAGLTKAEQRALDAVNLNRFFLVEVGVQARTSGYRVTIQRITVQRISQTHRQFCVVAAIKGPRPGQAVLPRATYSVHIVKSSWKPFGNDLPTAAVLRDTHGKLLDKVVYTLRSAPADLYPPRPALCRV